MNNQNHKLFCRLNQIDTEAEARSNLLQELNLLTPGSIPILEEATQTAARFLEIPICFLSLMLEEQLWLKSALGLSKLGFMNKLAQERQIEKENSFCTYVVENKQILAVEDALSDETYSQISLVADYGIRSYLGVPLITTTGHCLGTLAVMDLIPHQFTLKNQEFLALTAHWCIREVEANHYSQYYQTRSSETEIHPNHFHLNLGKDYDNLVKDYQLKLFQQITHEFRGPLTNIIGMAKVLKEETYGWVNERQKKYLEIIYNSGKDMSIVLEKLSQIKSETSEKKGLNLTSTDPKILIQKVINSLGSFSKLELEVTVNTPNNFYLLDQDKLRQTIYYLASAMPSHENTTLNLKFTIFTQSKYINISICKYNLISKWEKEILDKLEKHKTLTKHNIISLLQTTEPFTPEYTQLIQIFLSCYLVELQQGQILLQSCQDSGYQYIVKLPKVLVKKD